MNSPFPVFVRAKDCGDMARYESVEEMQRELEAIDVESGEYEAWDGNGSPIKLEVQAPIWLNCVSASSVPKLDELKAAILDFAAKAEVPIQAEELNVFGVDSLFQRILRERAKRKSSSGIINKLLAQ